MKRAVLVVAVAGAALGGSAAASWAEDAFAKITGSAQGIILGDQPAIPALSGSKDAVQIFSTTFGLTVPQSTTSTGGAGTIGRPVADPVALVKRFDRASPKLLRAAFTGEALTIDITWFMNFQGTPRKTVTIRLENAIITDIQAAAELNGASASGFETVTVTYQRITFSTPIIDSATGQVTGTSSVCLEPASGKTC